MKKISKAVYKLALISKQMGFYEMGILFLPPECRASSMPVKIQKKTIEKNKDVR